MDFQFSDEQKNLRIELQEFLRETIPSEYVAAHVGSQEQWDIHMDFGRKLAAKNWVAPAWPKQYGGLDWRYTSK